jgi:hypothetical protein
MNLESEKPNISATAAKWIILGIIGIGCLIAALVSYSRQLYTWIFAMALVGLFLVTTAWKKLRLLRAAAKALGAGRGELVVFYRDGNLKESQLPVIPVGADSLYFYGFSRERNDTRTFQWKRIIRVTDNEKDLTQNDILSRLES